MAYKIGADKFEYMMEQFPFTRLRNHIYSKHNTCADVSNKIIVELVSHKKIILILLNIFL